ncbi:MAG: hydratase [Oscillospiraceae bacterium]|nr:hydratase [Oscillospiraceae bacterium]
MINIYNNGAYLIDGVIRTEDRAKLEKELSGKNITLDMESARKRTITSSILKSHDISKINGKCRIKFDGMASHDITYVGIIQTARTGGLNKFPMPYALTNCHNSLCAVGGTINEDDHAFGLSAAKKYGGIYVPANQAVIHQFVRERMTGCGKMLLGSDSHTRYGALGTMGIGEGGPELVKQLLNNTYDIDQPQAVLVYLTNKPRHGVGPHDVALALCAAVFKSKTVNNKILEFAGPGVGELSVDFRNGIDVMTTETTCLSSVWITDEKVKHFYENHGRKLDYKKLEPENGAYYDTAIEIDLSKIESMIALPFHPSNAIPIKELLRSPKEYLSSVEEDARKQFGEKAYLKLASTVKNGNISVEQGIIAGCAGGTFENICAAASILENGSTGNDYFSLSVYPSSMPVYLGLTRKGITEKLMESGAVLKPAFCGPCFGAGDVPSNGTMSIRHTTRNFPNREGSNPDGGQSASVALMDARSIAATAANKGILTPATECDYDDSVPEYIYDGSVYEKRIYNGFGKPDPEVELRYGPNITDWPKISPLTEDIMLKVAAVILDEVTTTDELIPSGEISSYRSNPQKLSEFALFRRVPEYVGRAKLIRSTDEQRREGVISEELANVYNKLGISAEKAQKTALGSVIYANKPGDGSAREQAASCQRVLGGSANIARDYATKRYRSNLINWGIIPFILPADQEVNFKSGDFIYIPDVKKNIAEGKQNFVAKVVSGNDIYEIKLKCSELTDDEKSIILSGCLINEYAKKL